jgi:hypothetical protein
MSRRRRLLGYLVAAAITAVLVGSVGAPLVNGSERTLVWLGVAIGFAVQLVLFVFLFLFAFAERPLVAHGLGVVGRFMAFGVTAFLCLLTGLTAAAPLLLPLITVFFLTTLVEPFFLPKHVPVR